MENERLKMEDGIIRKRLDVMGYYWKIIKFPCNFMKFSFITLI